MSDRGTDPGAALPDEGLPRPEETLDELLPEEASPLDDVAHEVEVVEEPMPEELGLELPSDPEEAQRLLLRELAEARRDADEYLDTVRRLAADFENFRKRVERDQAENVRRASQRAVELLLPVLDSFDAALAWDPRTEREGKLLEGLRSIHQQLLEALAKEGVEPIEAAGKPFDPAVHEAVAGPSEGDGELVVVEELRQGYTMRGRVLRPALVRVGHA